MVRPGGFEPPTSWFVAMRSIQLIYGRTPKRAAHLAKPPPPLQVDFPFNPKIPAYPKNKPASPARLNALH